VYYRLDRSTLSWQGCSRGIHIINNHTNFLWHTSLYPCCHIILFKSAHEIQHTASLIPDSWHKHSDLGLHSASQQPVSQEDHLPADEGQRQYLSCTETTYFSRIPVEFNRSSWMEVRSQECAIWLEDGHAPRSIIIGTLLEISQETLKFSCAITRGRKEWPHVGAGGMVSAT